MITSQRRKQVPTSDCAQTERVSNKQMEVRSIKPKLRDLSRGWYHLEITMLALLFALSRGS